MKRLAISIYNKEALSSLSAENLIDPTRLVVYILDKDESLVVRPVTKRISQGRYIVEVDEDLFSNGQTYSVIYDYDLQPGCEQVQRYSFVYNATTTIEGLCQVTGSIGTVFPVASARIEYSVLKDGKGVHFNEMEDVALSDAFGEWSLFVPQGRQCRIVIPSMRENKTFLAPMTTSVKYSDLTALQSPIITDRFGNLV